MKINLIEVLIIICIFLILGFGVFFSFNDKTYTITVTDKERIMDEGGSKYLIFGDDEDGNSLVFENRDNLLRFKFNSSNIQGRLKIGKTYDVVVVGYRIPILSAYENIIDCYEITD